MGEWLDPADDRWESTLRDVRHDFYHLPGYAELAARTDGGSATAYYAEIGGGRILIPLLVRSLDGVRSAPPRAHDAVSPYGYAGPLISEALSDGDVERAIGAFIDDGARRGLITSFVRTHPLLSPRITAAAARNPRARVVAHGPTVSIDLTLDVVTLDRQVRTDHRRALPKLRAAGFSVRFDDWDWYAAFQAAYGATMQRLEAAPQYHFNEAYFAGLRECLGSALHLCAVLDTEGEFAGGGLFTHVGKIVQYHLSATVERFLRMAPSKLMIYEARNWAQQRGAAVLHLGGGVGGQRDSLHMFKRGFGAGEHAFHSINVVHDPEAYATLAAERAEADFFPAYRAR